MTVSNFFRNILSGALLLVLSSSLSAKAPNIILILADDMGPGEMSHAGGLIPTPALDRMAAEGMRFNDAHTSSAVCTPTRYGILTGRYNWRSRLKKSVLFSTTSPALMDPERLNLPQFLKDNGYYTGMLGKWHLGVDWVLLDKDDPNYKPKFFNSWTIDYTQPLTNGPLDMGFDEAYYVSGSLDMPPYTYIDGDRVVKIPTVNKGFPHSDYNEHVRIGAAAEDFDASTSLEEWATRAQKFIHSRAVAAPEQPFFLYMPITSPHTPVTPGKAFKGRYPRYGWYADFIAETDWVVEQVLKAVQEAGVDEETMVIFTADNGFASYVFSSKKNPKRKAPLMEDGYAPSAHYRGFKTSVYEGGHRVPFLVRWPATVEADSVSDVTICTTDFFATFADMIGQKDTIPADAAEDSFSFYSSLKGGAEPIRPFTIHHSGAGTFAIRKGDWKLILTERTPGGGYIPRRPIKTPSEVVQLYNMKEDPSETTNLEMQYPERIEELVQELSVALRRGRTTPGPEQTNEGWPYRTDKSQNTTAFPQLLE